MTRQPPDDVRGFGVHRSRVYPANQAEFDRVVAEHGLDTSDPDIDDGMDHLRRFLHVLIHMGPRWREILFGRLQGLEFAEIGDALLGGATKQAAQNEFAAMMAEYPQLMRAFPEAKHKREKHDGNAET